MGPRRAGPQAVRPRPLSAARRWRSGALVVIALLVGACGGGGSSPRAAVGRLAPDFSTVDVDGHRLQLSGLRGSPVLVNFWASWCTPCRAEFPRLRTVAGDAHIVGVVFEDSKALAAAFARDHGATWPVVVDPKGQIADAYDVHQKPGIPVTYAIDRTGVVRAKHLGEASDADLRALLTAVGVTPT